MSCLKVTATALLLMCIFLSGCVHSTCGSIGVDGSFRFRLLHNDTAGDHALFACESGRGEVRR